MAESPELADVLKRISTARSEHSIRKVTRNALNQTRSWGENGDKQIHDASKIRRRSRVTIQRLREKRLFEPHAFRPLLK